MNFETELLPGTWHIPLRRFTDARGTFVKTYARSVFDAVVPGFDMKEEFYSVSGKNVVRGMHFQWPPHDHAKLVYCPVGAVLDVVLDLRVGAGYGRTASVVLSADEPALVLVPSGVAHGFRALAEQSVMIYKTGTEHAPSHDAGIRWDSFGFDWGLTAPATLSTRDGTHPEFSGFSSPF